MIKKGLNKKRTYILLEYGTGFIARQIRRFSKEYCSESDKVPTHVAMLRYNLDKWWVYEAHAKANKKFGIPSGVRRYTSDKWLQVEDINKFEIYPLSLDIKAMEEHIGESYSLGDIKELMHAAIHNSNGQQKNRQGLICSEYFALCHRNICSYYNLPPHCITPAHIKNYVDKLQIKPIIK